MPRVLTLTQAIALNVANMVGIGPFITIPLFLQTMQGPHALVAWGVAAIREGLACPPRKMNISPPVTSKRTGTHPSR